MSYQRTPREGTVTKADRRETKSGAPMIVLSVQLSDGTEERVSFFDDADVKVEVSEGDHINYAMTRKGNYINGRDLQLSAPSQREVAPVRAQPAKSQAPVSSDRPPLHSLSAEELTTLYNQVNATGQGEGAFLGQISNQIRYARIEELLHEILAKIIPRD
jgi:hypothetical protein